MGKMKIGFSAHAVDDIVMFRALIHMEVMCRNNLGLKTKMGNHLEGSKYMDDLFIECDESEVDHIRWMWTKACDAEREKEAIMELERHTRSLIGDDKHEEY